MDKWEYKTEAHDWEKSVEELVLGTKGGNWLEQKSLYVDLLQNIGIVISSKEKQIDSGYSYW